MSIYSFAQFNPGNSLKNIISGSDARTETEFPEWIGHNSHSQETRSHISFKAVITGLYINERNGFRRAEKSEFSITLFKNPLSVGLEIAYKMKKWRKIKNKPYANRKRCHQQLHSEGFPGPKVLSLGAWEPTQPYNPNMLNTVITHTAFSTPRKFTKPLWVIPKGRATSPNHTFKLRPLWQRPSWYPRCLLLLISVTFLVCPPLPRQLGPSSRYSLQGRAILNFLLCQHCSLGAGLTLPQNLCRWVCSVHLSPETQDYHIYASSCIAVHFKHNSYAKLNLWPPPMKPTPPNSCLIVTLFLQFSRRQNFGTILLSYTLLTLPGNPISKLVQTRPILPPLLLYYLGLSFSCILPVLL